MKVIRPEDRPRPKLATPAKGSVGDMCHEEDAAGTSIPSLLQRYGGNLDDLIRWRKNPIPYDCDLVPQDLAEAHALVGRIEEMIDTLELPEGVSREDAVAAIKSGDFSVFKSTPNTEKEPTHEPSPSSDQSQSE